MSFHSYKYLSYLLTISVICKNDWGDIKWPVQLVI